MQLEIRSLGRSTIEEEEEEEEEDEEEDDEEEDDVTPVTEGRRLEKFFGPTDRPTDRPTDMVTYISAHRG